MNDIDVCNIGMVLIGANPISDMAEGTSESITATALYEQTLQSELSKYPWRFAQRMVDLGEPLAAAPLERWDRAYTLPAECIIPRAVLVGDCAVEFDWFEDEIYANTGASDAVTAQLTIRPATAKLPPHFIQAMGYRLASVFAGSVTGKAEFVGTFAKLAFTEFADARRADAQGRTASKMRTGRQILLAALIMRLRSLQASFSGGELDPKMIARSDLKQYQAGAASLRNSAAQVQGGVRRRPGTRYLANLGANGRLFGFRFNDTQENIFHFLNAAVKMYSTVGTLLDTEVGPWTAAQLSELKWSQSGDTVIVTHPSFEPRRILRTSATTWSIATFPWENTTNARPYAFHGALGVTLTVSAVGPGAGLTATASAATFSAAHVGTTLKIKDGSNFRYFEITGFTSSTIVTGTLAVALSSVATAFSTWLEWAYSEVRGWPAAVVFHAQRTWLGGGTLLPSFLFGTKTAAYFNFDVGTGLDAEGIAISIPRGVPSIRHLVSSLHLQVFTDTGEFMVPESDTRPLTPANMSIRRQTPFGCSHVPPQILDKATLFVQGAGRVVREYLYDDFQQNYSSEGVSLVSTHLIGTVVDSAILYGTRNLPEQLAFYVNDSGAIAVFHAVRAQKIASWVPWDTDGLFKSVATLGDIAYALVARVIGGATVYYLEKFDFDLSVDCALGVSGASASTWTGLSHLEGKTAYGVWGNLSYGTDVVTAGSVTFDEAATDLDVGLFYERTIKTMPVPGALPDGTIIGERVRLANCVLLLDQAVAATVQGRSLLLRQVTDDLSLAPAAVTGPRQFGLRGWDRLGQVTISQSEPLPLTVLGMTLEVLA